MSRTRARPGLLDPGRQAVNAATEVSVPRVKGLVLGPHVGRRQNLIVAPWCPHCEGSHRHVSEILAPFYRRCCPVTGRSYEISAVVERDTRRWRRA
ncbi:MAG: hypothetical protein ACRDT2_02485 [Natronosporangium sp.]